MGSMTSVLFFTLFGVALSLPSNFNSAAVCNSKECKDVARFIKGNLNEDADPCEDFYAFACGGFNKAFPIPKGTYKIDGLDLVQNQVTERQVGLLDDPKLKNHGSKVVRKAKKLYDECMNGNLENATAPLTARVFQSASQPGSLVPEGMYKKEPLINTPEEICRQEVNSKYSLVITRLYLDKYFPIAEHKATRDAIKNVWKAFRNNIIKKVPWMDNAKKETVNQGLDDLEINTGYPDWLSDNKELDREYEGKTHAFWGNPLAVYHQFVRAVPKITTPAGILHRHIFNRKMPNYINYGAGAFIAARDISQGVNFWTKANDDGKARANECIINQVETVEEPQIGAAYARGSLILSEMLADIGAINASYTAYKAANKGQEQQLPGLTKYTPDQLFFLAQANIWCANSDDDYIKLFMILVSEPYNYYRVVVPAMNSPVFAEAYNCKARTRMNPTDKCSLW